ncbi:Hypothetical_protein [Hexamita inflata]|uniref:Hypothetical_protein n=1 Tax=Hexamita inflata TaxID=28002 RepID=A0AA86U5Z7_9EUKA|nr:Hypothetical protein HINF_LOCUS29939 [Hexamita inflata]
MSRAGRATGLANYTLGFPNTMQLVTVSPSLIPSMVLIVSVLATDLNRPVLQAPYPIPAASTSNSASAMIPSSETSPCSTAIIRCGAPLNIGSALESIHFIQGYYLSTLFIYNNQSQVRINSLINSRGYSHE